MAASAAPGSAERQARGGAASATGNAVSRPVPSRACRVLARAPARAAAGIWRAFGVPCLAMVGSLLVFFFFWVLACGDDQPPLFGWTFHGWAGGGCCLPAAERASEDGGG
jgi:hypothetical protein